MVHANTSNSGVYLRILSTDWRVHLEQCYRNPDTLKRARLNAKPVRDPLQLRGSAQFCKLNDCQNNGEL